MFHRLKSFLHRAADLTSDIQPHGCLVTQQCVIGFKSELHEGMCMDGWKGLHNLDEIWKRSSFQLMIPSGTCAVKLCWCELCFWQKEECIHALEVFHVQCLMFRAHCWSCCAMPWTRAAGRARVLWCVTSPETWDGRRSLRPRSESSLSFAEPPYVSAAWIKAASSAAAAAAAFTAHLASLVPWRQVGEPGAVILLRCSADTMSRRLQARRGSAFTRSDGDRLLHRRAESFCSDTQALVSHYGNKSVLHMVRLPTQRWEWLQRQRQLMFLCCS